MRAAKTWPLASILLRTKDQSKETLMSTASDRRVSDASRIPFDGMVEIGGALGPSFEAQAVNLSEEGMHLRTAYLPEIGQPVTCRFDAGQGLVVVAAGEVLWRDDMGEGGEFGIRFTNLDATSATALQRMIGMVEDGMAIHPPQGRKVRLHIDGLASPMRARVKGVNGSSVTAFSELGFLQVGKQLDLEDATTGSKRPALIDRVEVEVQRDTRIPQLVVTLRYDDEAAHTADVASMTHASDNANSVDGGSLVPCAMGDEADGAPENDSHDEMAVDVHAEDLASASAHGNEAHDLKSAFARNAAKVTPALLTWAKRAQTTVALLAARASAKRNVAGADIETPVRRTTAPAPGGGLHTAGRKVVRGEIDEPTANDDLLATPKLAVTKKRMAVGGAIGVAAIFGLVLMRKPAPAPVVAVAPVEAPVEIPAPVAVAPPPPVVAAPAAVTDSFTNPPTGAAGGHVTPFGNGSVTHGNVVKIKMDGVVGRIEGASQPSGFTVVIPGRKSLDAAASLAAKDLRIKTIAIANEPNGAELTVTFKDGVPNYQVKAHGDTLEMHLAKAGHAGDKAPEAHAKPHKKKKTH